MGAVAQTVKRPTTMRETVETVSNFILGGSKIAADGDCGHEIKKCVLLGRIAMTNLDSILKSRDITLQIKVCLVKAMVFLAVMYGCESWTVKKAEGWRTDAFELCVAEDSCEPLGLQGDQTSSCLPVHHQLPEFTQTHVHWVGDAIQPSHPLLSRSPAFNLSQHQCLFKWVSLRIRGQKLPGNSKGTKETLGTLYKFPPRNSDGTDGTQRQGTQPCPLP